jgi:four helix bundle protein
MYSVTRRLPESEKFGLASQVRRAAVSLTNNIAEGHGRWHWLDHIKFVLQSRGSLQELIDDLNVCEDENYLPVPEIVKLKEQGWQLLRRINGYLRYLRDSKTGDSMKLQEIPAPYGLDRARTTSVPAIESFCSDPDDDLETWLSTLPNRPNHLTI